jgi:tetratricopeptide (TPR) repeat protein
MKKVFLYIFLCIPIAIFSQNEQLAQNYFDQGEFEKAILIYDDLAKKQPNNMPIFQKQVLCYQQLKQFEKAENLIVARINKTKKPNLYVALGYNFELQKDLVRAKKNYKTAIDKIKDNPNEVYLIARDFEQKVLIEQAIESYKLAATLIPNSNFDYQIALLQGQIGQTDLMIDTLLDYSFKFPNNLALVQNQLTRFLEEDTNKTFVEYLKKALLIRTQKTQDIFWNQYMSWFFIQQKEYAKAFVQEKAIFKRTQDNLTNIISLAGLASEQNESILSKEILNFIIQNTKDLELQMEAYYQLVSIEINNATPQEYANINEKLDLLLKKYGITPYSIKLQILKSHFEAFYLNQFDNAKSRLVQALDLPINIYQNAEIKMELADILLLDEQFNQAILYYAQIETNLENDPLAHEASFKLAQSNYYKGDFSWARNQFKVLKSSTSQLIANNALELFLIINDATDEDSTQVALKKFAKADFLAYQNKSSLALQEYEQIAQMNQYKSVQELSLIRIGKIFEKQKKYTQAIESYQKLLTNFPESIYQDEALFYTGEIYQKELHEVEKAKINFEKIITTHPDSIFFIEARKNYRRIRGDTNT